MEEPAVEGAADGKPQFGRKRQTAKKEKKRREISRRTRERRRVEANEKLGVTRGLRHCRYPVLEAICKHQSSDLPLFSLILRLHELGESSLHVLLVALHYLHLAAPACHQRPHCLSGVQPRGFVCINGALATAHRTFEAGLNYTYLLFGI